MTGKRYDVLLVDYGVGNHQSILNALEKLGYAYRVSCDPDEIKAAPCYILPGVGAFAEAMDNLRQRNIISVLQEEVLHKKKPLLGICLGMQVLAEKSEENGLHQGLNWIKGQVIRIRESTSIKVPHVGWNELCIIQRKPLFERHEERPHFYFDHSYHFQAEKAVIAATVEYGKELIVAIQQGNIFGVQFHPEKSQNAGLRLYRSFLNYAQKWREGKNAEE